MGAVPTFFMVNKTSVPLQLAVTCMFAPFHDVLGCTQLVSGYACAE